jgi:hypothetical protein
MDIHAALSKKGRRRRMRLHADWPDYTLRSLRAYQKRPYVGRTRRSPNCVIFFEFGFASNLDRSSGKPEELWSYSGTQNQWSLYKGVNQPWHF